MSQRRFLLRTPLHDENHLPVPWAPPRTSAVRVVSQLASQVTSRLNSMVREPADLQIVQEFRNKLRQAEELVGKLAFNLREIQDSRRKTGETPQRQKPAVITNLPKSGH